MGLSDLSWWADQPHRKLGCHHTQPYRSPECEGVWLREDKDRTPAVSATNSECLGTPQRTWHYIQIFYSSGASEEVATESGCFLTLFKSRKFNFGFTLLGTLLEPGSLAWKHEELLLTEVTFFSSLPPVLAGSSVGHQGKLFFLTASSFSNQVLNLGLHQQELPVSHSVPLAANMNPHPEAPCAALTWEAMWVAKVALNSGPEDVGWSPSCIISHG